METFHCRPVTSGTLDDLLTLFGPKGASAGCWCMFWRTSRAAFERNGNDGNREAFLGLIDGGQVPGILAYDGDTPVGWCSIAPRETYPPLERSRRYARLDDQPVWSVTCFYIPKAQRHRGIGAALLRGAIAHVRANGGTIVEAYPSPRSSEGAYMGSVPGLTAAGFTPAGGDDEQQHPIYRYRIGQ